MAELLRYFDKETDEGVWNFYEENVKFVCSHEELHVAFEKLFKLRETSFHLLLTTVDLAGTDPKFATPAEMKKKLDKLRNEDL